MSDLSAQIRAAGDFFKRHPSLLTAAWMPGPARRLVGEAVAAEEAWLRLTVILPPEQHEEGVAEVSRTMYRSSGGMSRSDACDDLRRRVAMGEWPLDPTPARHDETSEGPHETPLREDHPRGEPPRHVPDSR